MLLEALLNERHRATKDLDLLGYGPNDPARMVDVFAEILSSPVEPDGLDFDAGRITAEPIRDGDEYSGVRVLMTATLAGARVKIHVDVGFGDAITPAPVDLKYPTVLLDMPAPSLRAYPIETVVAEKFQILCERGMLNSRMKDYYDLWTICRRLDIPTARLAPAIAATFVRRRTPIPSEPPVGLSAAFSSDATKRTQWAAFLKKGRLAIEPPPLEAVVEALAAFLMPSVREAAGDQSNS